MPATSVLIIGGGATGTGLARDLALRAVPCILAEQTDLTAGASGANHGLLHSGARYVSNDPQSALHCRIEGALLKRLAPGCVDNTRGLFVAVQGDDERFIADFPGWCAACGIAARPLQPREARELEPALSSSAIAAFEVDDATIDPFRLCVENMADAKLHGATLLTHTRVVEFLMQARRIRAVRLLDVSTGQQSVVEAELVVNAGGAWSADIAALARIPIQVVYSKGTLLVTQHRLTTRVINRLRRPSNADIIVPGGTVSVLGTTSVRLGSLGHIAPTVEEVDTIVGECAALVPALESTRILRAYAGVRPLVSTGAPGDDRAMSRDFTLLDHCHDGVDNFITITGGKLTTYRQMAEKAADLCCDHLGVTAPCLTRDRPLVEACAWTVPAQSPRHWLAARAPRDPILCECEQVPASAVDSIVASILEANLPPTLKDLAVRSRIGKGSCQGAFCSVRVLAHLYEQGRLESGDGLPTLREFLNERWKGEHTTLWGHQLAQAELKEALHCALWGLEL